MAEVDTLEAIRKRRSIRRYTDAAIPKADLETIVDAGRLAATGSNRQPWDFVVVTDLTVIQQFKVAGAWIGTAGAVIVVVMDPVSRWWIEDGAAAIENMLLASTALGYGACWVEGDALPREEQFKLLLGVYSKLVMRHGILLVSGDDHHPPEGNHVSQPRCHCTGTSCRVRIHAELRQG
jgi:nitroreductase